MIAQHIEKESAIIFDVQRFSLQDGPGIRTTVFFKGCPLRCIWCHNPESFTKQPQLIYHHHLCVNCRQCVNVCPNGAQKEKCIEEQLLHYLDWSKCNGCGKCMTVCNYDALAVAGVEYTPGKLYDQIKGDFLYHELEGGDGKGGVTFSGGEPLQNVAFIKAFRGLAPDLHIALETSGYAALQQVKELAEVVDLILFDYKVTDEKKHQSLCGVSNKLILANLDYLCLNGYEVILRLPLIPDVNDDQKHLEGIAALMKKYPQIKKAQIMPYHTLGIHKRDELGLPPQAWGERGADEKTQQKWLAHIKKHGIKNIELSV